MMAACTSVLQWGHGREAMDGLIVWAKYRVAIYHFNGAMAVRPWMGGPGRLYQRPPPLQWGHGREAMDGQWPSDP